MLPDTMTRCGLNKRRETGGGIASEKGVMTHEGMKSEGGERKGVHAVMPESGNTVKVRNGRQGRIQRSEMRWQAAAPIHGLMGQVRDVLRKHMNIPSQVWIWTTRPSSSTCGGGLHPSRPDAGGPSPSASASRVSLYPLRELLTDCCSGGGK